MDQNSILILSSKQGQLSRIDSYLAELLLLFQYQYRNEGNEALNQILDALLGVEEEGVTTIFKRFIRSLQEFNLSQLFISANLKLCRIYLQNKDSKGLEASCANIEQSLQGIADKDRRDSLQVELYAHQIRLHELTGNFSRIRIVYRQLQRLNASIHDQQISGTINETKGKMCMLEGRWENARKFFMDAFQNYQDCGDAQAKRVLCYAVTASILEGYIIILSYSLAISLTYLKICDLGCTIKIQRFSNSSRLEQHSTRMTSNHTNLLRRYLIKLQYQIIEEDSFLKEFSDEIIKCICLKKIIKLFKAYSKIRVSYLANVLMTDEQNVIQYAEELILSGHIKCIIDVPNMVLEKLYSCDKNMLLNEIISLVLS